MLNYTEITQVRIGHDTNGPRCHAACKGHWVIVVRQAARQRYAFPDSTRRASWMRRTFATLVARPAITALP